MSLPDPAPVFDLLDAFRRSKTMFTAVSLGVFDALAAGPVDCVSLAGRLGANAGALERLLNGCAALGLLRKNGAAYSNEPAADVYLRRDSPNTLTGYVLYSDEILWRLWAHLDEAVREGSNRWMRAFGRRDALFEHFFATEERMRTFLRGMHGFGVISSPAVVAAFDLARFRRLADLGGATGHLAIAACERYPDLRAVVFDLPRVIPIAREEAERSSAAARIEFAAGDFFEDPLPEAGLYVLGRILHDWSEDNIARLLRKIWDALPPGGALLVAERLLNPDKTGPVPAAMQCLNMLVCTEGRERTAAEYQALLRAAGFAQVEARRTGAPLDAVLATKT